MRCPCGYDTECHIWCGSGHEAGFRPGCPPLEPWEPESELFIFEEPNEA